MNFTKNNQNRFKLWNNLWRNFSSLPSSWILYASTDILVINKPSGLAVQGGLTCANNLNSMVFEYVRSNSHENIKPFLLHRLDKDTSGVVLFAINEKAAAFYSKLFRERKIKKEYVAVVHKATQSKLKRDEIQRISYPLVNEQVGSFDRTYVDVQRGKEAITDCKLIAEDDSRKYLLLKLMPQTGRKHQLRVHCAFLNHPIVGDNKYGLYQSKRSTLSDKSKLCLHALSISFPQFNKNGQESFIKIIAPLPLHLQTFFPNVRDI